MLIKEKRKDPLGAALWDYLTAEIKEDIQVHCNLTEDDIIPVSLLFRSWDALPEYEQAALKACKGKILDIGAGAGSHSLILQSWGMEVSAMDISPGAIRVMKARGLNSCIHEDIYQWKGGQYDTLLMLMNGIGLVGSLKRLSDFLEHARQLLNEGGQIILDSSDLSYLEEEGPDMEWLSNGNGYFGEVEFIMSYGSIVGDPFPWLYLDLNTLTDIAYLHGYRCKQIAQGPHYEYTAILEKV